MSLLNSRTDIGKAGTGIARATFNININLNFNLCKLNVLVMNKSVSTSFITSPLFVNMIGMRKIMRK